MNFEFYSNRKTISLTKISTKLSHKLLIDYKTSNEYLMQRKHDLNKTLNFLLKTKNIFLQKIFQK
jgi:hypothetical protein